MSVLRLTQFTDPHLYGSENESLRGVPTLPALRAALAHARAREWPPHALLVTGDLVQDDPGGYAHFRSVFGGMGLPVLCLPGNHDEPEAMRRELSGEPFVLADFFDLGRWRIVLLDSCIPGAASGAISRVPAYHRRAPQRARDRVGTRTSKLRRPAQRRAAAGDALHLRAVPAQLR